MIKSDFGKIEIKGNQPLLAAEFVSLINMLIENKIFSRRRIKELIEEGLKSQEQIKKEYSEKYKDGISTKRMQELIGKIVEARKSGLVEDEESTEPMIETILDNEDVKITKISLDGKGKSKEEIGDMIKKIFEEGEILE